LPSSLSPSEGRQQQPPDHNAAIGDADTGFSKAGGFAAGFENPGGRTTPGLREA